MSDKFELIFSSRHFSKKMTKQIQLYYLLTCFRLFLDESEDTKKTF